MTEQKTMQDHIKTGLTYSGTSAISGVSLAKILVFFYPYLDPIALELVAVFGVITNFLMILYFKQDN